MAEVVVAQPSFFSELPALVTPDRLPDWKAWTRFRVISSMAPYLSQDFVEENFLKSEALEKLGEFRPHIGYPTKWRDYSGLEIRVDDQGSTCDGDGALRNWWTDADRQAFEHVRRPGQPVRRPRAGADPRPHGHGELTILLPDQSPVQEQPLYVGVAVELQPDRARWPSPPTPSNG